MQLVYEKNPDIGQLGAVGGSFEPKRVLSLLAEGAVSIGAAVKLGTAGDQCIELTAGDSAADLYGVALKAQNIEQGVGGVVEYLDEAMVPVMQMGRCYVQLSDASGVYVGVELVAGADAQFLAGTSATSKVKVFCVEAPFTDSESRDVCLVELTGLQGAGA